MSKLHRVGIMGGTFSPIHNAHLLVANQVREQLHLNKMYLMPDYVPPHKNHKKTIDAQDRVNMIKLAIKNNPYFYLGTTDIDRKGKSYTYDTIKYLIKQYPNTIFYWVIGGDEVAYLHTWYHIDDLIKLPHFHFVAVKRSGYPVKSDYPVTWAKVPYFAISSTLIRNKVKHHKSIKYLVPNSVENYIKEHNLYK